MNRMHWTKRRKIAAGLIVAVLLAGIGVLGFTPALPWAANHYGFALPGRDGLPYRIHHAGRDYATQGVCAHADWCASQQSVCSSQTQLAAENFWPLHAVGQVNTLLGPSYPVLVPNGIPAGMTTTLLFVRYQGCYQVYALEGGP